MDKYYKLTLLLLGILFGVIISLILIAISPNYQMREYQIRTEMDSAYIYDHGRLAGSCKQGSDGIDSVILKDNL